MDKKPLKKPSALTLLSVVVLAITLFASPLIPAGLVLGWPLIMVWWYGGCILFGALLWVGEASHER